MRLLLADFDVICARHGRAALQLLALGIFPCVILVDVVKASVGGSELRRALLYDDRVRHIAVQPFPAPELTTAAGIGVAEVVADVADRASRACPYVAVFRRPAASQRFLSALRPPRVRNGAE